jgi:hypothetical protein
MPQTRYYEKCIIECTGSQFVSLMHTMQRDFDGLWPATAESSLEICSVDNERFDDPALRAGWVLYERSALHETPELFVDLAYAAATIELYDLPMQRVTVYFTDGQEPGYYPTGCIGKPFIHFVDALKTEVGLLSVGHIAGLSPDLQSVTSPTDLLLVKWMTEMPSLPIEVIAKRLQMSPGSVRTRRKQLRVMGYSL